MSNDPLDYSDVKREINGLRGYIESRIEDIVIDAPLKTVVLDWPIEPFDGSNLWVKSIVAKPRAVVNDKTLNIYVSECGFFDSSKNSPEPQKYDKKFFDKFTIDNLYRLLVVVAEIEKKHRDELRDILYEN